MIHDFSFFNIVDLADLQSFFLFFVAIHEREDRTTTITEKYGLGDAGRAIAYGTVGIVAPGAALPGGATATSNAATDVNDAQPPTIPEPDKAVCIFRSNIGTSTGTLLNKNIIGKAIIAIDLAKKYVYKI